MDRHNNGRTASPESGLERREQMQKSVKKSNKKTGAAGFVGVGICLVLVIADLVFFATKKEAYRTVDFWFVASALITLLPYLAIAVNALTIGRENEEKAE